jgi:hypothetical protein
VDKLGRTLDNSDLHPAPICRCVEALDIQNAKQPELNFGAVAIEEDERCSEPIHE